MTFVSITTLKNSLQMSFFFKKTIIIYQKKMFYMCWLKTNSSQETKFTIQSVKLSKKYQLSKFYILNIQVKIETTYNQNLSENNNYRSNITSVQQKKKFVVNGSLMIPSRSNTAYIQATNVEEYTKLVSRKQKCERHEMYLTMFDIILKPHTKY